MLGYKFLVIKDAFKTASKTFIIKRFLVLALSRLFARTRLDMYLFVTIALSFHFLRTVIAS